MQISLKHHHLSVCFDDSVTNFKYNFLNIFIKPAMSSENITSCFPHTDDDYENAEYLNNVAEEEEECEYQYILLFNIYKKYL